MRIRSATDADLVAILRLWREGTSVVSHTDDPEGLRGLLARDPEALLLAEDDGRLVGTLIAGWDGWRAWLYRLGVAPGGRRPGPPTAVVRHPEEPPRHLGARRALPRGP